MMNKQGRLVDGKVVGGIEWTKTVLDDGTERQGYTWNPVAGCAHGCRWIVKGQTAICYAEATAHGVARAAYPQRFAHHYWHPEILDEPLGVRESSRIFLDSMSDLMGAWVPREQIEAVLGMCQTAKWHTFQLLTKNAPRLLKFKNGFPPNVWIGVSMPPDVMFGHTLSRHQQERMLAVALDTLSQLPGENTTWMSFEPLSWDVTPILKGFPDALSWAVIGAASNGRTYYQPNPEHVNRLLDVLDANNCPVFFKGNLEWDARREEFPE